MRRYFYFLAMFKIKRVRKQIFTRVELASSVAIVSLAFFATYGLITGSITL